MTSLQPNAYVLNFKVLDKHPLDWGKATLYDYAVNQSPNQSSDEEEPDDGFWLLEQDQNPFYGTNQSNALAENPRKQDETNTNPPSLNYLQTQSKYCVAL